ncbi:MAG: UDP-3-O-(3-hydroxymyristoyl)glucosamine N-acyltransferase [Betaproteobacteria bacterium]|nr:UDP-3-O-(3-hydroxymyristoyl)glucosamine N-acyltransferase [Betaproteobacteria bacterium]
MYTLGDLVARFGGELIGDPELRISQVATLEQAAAHHLSFLSNPRYRSKLAATRAGAIIVGQGAREATAIPRIVADNPYAYFAKVSAFLNPPSIPAPGVHPTAVIEDGAEVAPGASIGPFAHIGKGVRIGERTWIGGGSDIGDEVTIGAGGLVYPRVVVYRGCVIGDRVILHSGSVIGSDGFGIALEEGRWLKIPQIGRVVIGNDVEIGANTTVDRGAMDDTVIEDGVKLDNQIQVGHNVRIGAHTAIAGCVGIAGSARIGRHCRIGGAASILGHLEIADHVEISAGTLITKSIRAAGAYTAVYPFAPHREWLRNSVVLRHLAELAEKVRRLEKRMAGAERSKT